MTGRYHLVGVAGVGMSALAQSLSAAGHEVSGSDRSFDCDEQADLRRKLEAAGISILPQDGGAVTPQTAALVVSTAIEAGNPDLDAAESHGVPVRHRAEVLASVVSAGTCIAVTGTSGKSTVTGMIGWILEQAGRSPTVINGAPVLNWVDEDQIGNFHAGDSGLSVFEADESDRSVLAFEPDWGVITNLSRDHFEIEETRELFDAFGRQCNRGLVSAVHDEGLLEEFTHTRSDAGVEFELEGERFSLSIPGAHNALNAAIAALLCKELGLGVDAIRDGLAGFRGIQRRLEHIGDAGGVAVYDDYAHNPAKIRAAWETLCERHARIRAIWRPHGYGPLQMMLDELAALFSDLCRRDDRLFVLPVYDAGGSADRSIGSEALIDRLDARCELCPGLGPAFEEALVGELQPGDCVLIMGARDPGLPVFARHLLRTLRA